MSSQLIQKLSVELNFVKYRTSYELNWLFGSCELRRSHRALVHANTQRDYLNILNNTCFLESLSTGRCRQRTVRGNCCVFPFVYRGRRYRSCTSRGSKRPWCSTVPGYKRGQPWGYCRGKRGKIGRFRVALNLIVKSRLSPISRITVS